MNNRTVVSIVIAGVVLAGCARDPELVALQQTLPVAVTAGSAHSLGEAIESSLNATTTVSDADKAYLRARAAVLKVHGENLSDAIRRHDPAMGDKQAITLANLRARGSALEDEYRATFREWGFWQVQHGIKTPDEVFEVFDHGYDLK